MFEKFKYFIMNCLPDKLYVKHAFRKSMGYKIDLRHPKTFNEKITWLKLHDRNPFYTLMIDKYEVKKIITRELGEEYVVPLFGVWDRTEDIEFEKLPNQFVIKTTNGGGGRDVIICRDKANFDIEQARKKLKLSLKQNAYKLFREQPYKSIKPRIIAEEYLIDEKLNELFDYKFFCFDGKVKAIGVVMDRCIGQPKWNMYDSSFNLLPIKYVFPNYDKIIQKPPNFELMKKFALQLSKNMPHVRVDFYDTNGQLYFGELTYYSASGMGKFEPNEWDMIFGDWIDLRIN